MVCNMVSVMIMVVVILVDRIMMVTKLMIISLSYRMRSMDDESFKQHSRDLLLNKLIIRIEEQIQQHEGKVVGMAVGIA